MAWPGGGVDGDSEKWSYLSVFRRWSCQDLLIDLDVRC